MRRRYRRHKNLAGWLIAGGACAGMFTVVAMPIGYVATHMISLADAIVGQDGESQSPATVSSRVLSDWNERIKTESYWRDRSDGGSGEQPEIRSSSNGTHRTVCVRLCDGFYWPVSFATTQSRLGRDTKTCEQSCSSPTRLFVQSNPGAGPPQMVDTNGQPYSKLTNAFHFQTSYDASCKCKPHPWERDALDRHRLFALEQQQAAKGNKTAATELDLLRAEMKSRGVTGIDVAPGPSAEGRGKKRKTESAQHRDTGDVSQSPDPRKAAAAENWTARNITR